jgi:hypothetical protein
VRKKRLPSVYMLMISRFDHPPNWKWNHARVNVIILKLKSAEYALRKLQDSPLPLVWHPLRPAKLVERIYWGMCGVLYSRKGNWIQMRRQRMSFLHSDFKIAISKARKICRALERAGHVVEWNGWNRQETQ